MSGAPRAGASGSEEAGGEGPGGGADGRCGEPAGMLPVPGGRFRMGSDRHYPEEAPAHDATVAPFRMDRAPVTNARFARFVAATGYRTVAERAPDPALHPDADPALLVPGGLVFSPGEVPWRYVPGACWRDPRGDGAAPPAEHPVVQVAFADALAFARWEGAALPTEAEWEFAARGGLEGAEFAWGAEFAPGGVHQANTWQGRFPFEDAGADGHAGTSPVGAFPANGYGLVDMIGNVWEWTGDVWGAHGGARRCCGGVAAAGARRVIKGGSHLCAPESCRRYRPAARQGLAEDSAATHVGFRCVRR